MRLLALRWLRFCLAAAFALLAAAFVGLAVYAVLQFGLWWPRLFDFAPTLELLLTVVTMLPFLLLFTRLAWSRPLGWLAARFAALLAPLDRRIDARRPPSQARGPAPSKRGLSPRRSAE